MDITYEQLRATVIVLLALCGAALTVVNLIKGIRDLRKPNEEHVNDVHKMLANDKSRLDAHDRQLEHIAKRIDGVEHSTSEQGKDIRELMNGVMALLEHELHNGNSDEMDGASKSIKRRLIER